MNPNMRNEKLRGVFEMLGFEGVQTVISSGNVLFESPSRAVRSLETMIEEAIREQLGFTSATIIRSHQRLSRLLAENPFGKTEDTPITRLQVTFLKKKQRTDLKLPYRSRQKGYSIISMNGNEIFSAVDLTGATTPDLMARLEKEFGKEVTTRTWKTVDRIVKRMDQQT